MAAADARIRAFAAIEIGDAARAMCAQLIQRLRQMPARVSWVKQDNLHLTLRFLGDVTEKQIANVAGALRSELAVCESFEASLRGVGTFPNPRRPSVIWTGFKSLKKDVARIQSITERAAGRIGLEAEDRVFVPHVTLGRVREESRADVIPTLERENDFATDAFLVEAVSLFSSELTPHGARYTRLYRLTLDGHSGARTV